MDIGDNLVIVTSYEGQAGCLRAQEHEMISDLEEGIDNNIQ